MNVKSKQFFPVVKIFHSKASPLVRPWWWKYFRNSRSSFKNRYLQVYQPIKIKDVIALEPTTSISDSFNNKIGLMEIQPSEEKKFNWLINLDINK